MQSKLATKKQGLDPVDEVFWQWLILLAYIWQGKVFFLLPNQFVLLLQYFYQIDSVPFFLIGEDQHTVDTEVQVSFCLYLFPLCDVAKYAWNSV